MIDLLRNWFPTFRITWAIVAIVVTAVASTWLPVLLWVAYIVTLCTIAACVIDTVLLWSGRVSVTAERQCDQRLSNGEFNPIAVHVKAEAPFATQLTILDEVPIQLQERSLTFDWMNSGTDTITFSYEIRPVARGVLRFGAINVFVRTRLGLIQRRFPRDAERAVEVHPSIMEMRRAEIATFSNRQHRLGVHKQRRLGHTMEFEKISTYTTGDDLRTVNWKATARRNSLMVNQYQDERSQDIYSVIDLGRSMRFAHNGMTFLDHAINASLAFSNVVIKKQDRAGLITYGAHEAKILPANAGNAQLAGVMKGLYAIETEFEQSDDDRLVDLVRRRLPSRTLLMLYTNIESVDAARRRLPAFRLLSRSHVLVVNFFDNTGIRATVDQEPQTMEDIYRQTIARATLLEKNEIRAELRRAGIYTVLSAPQSLSIASINAYLDLKTRGLV
ncbi:MAG TPA: DUF58 domain-containing protein [Candidatus Didemnitutus sp.]|nr:DUF58 domain-containing protein [Candidatus Didemnitutus sp.]